MRRPMGNRYGIQIPKHLESDAFIMRLVMRRIARYDEIVRFWDINEVSRANELLDIQDDAEWLASEEMRRQTKSGRG